MKGGKGLFYIKLVVYHPEISVYLHANFIWRSEDNVQWLVISFYHVGSEEQTQVLGFEASALTHGQSPCPPYLFSNLQSHLSKLTYLSDLP